MAIRVATLLLLFFVDRRGLEMASRVLLHSSVMAIRIHPSSSFDASVFVRSNFIGSEPVFMVLFVASACSQSLLRTLFECPCSLRYCHGLLRLLLHRHDSRFASPHRCSVFIGSTLSLSSSSSSEERFMWSSWSPCSLHAVTGSSCRSIVLLVQSTVGCHVDKRSKRRMDPHRWFAEFFFGCSSVGKLLEFV